jgi:glycerate kinase
MICRSAHENFREPHSAFVPLSEKFDEPSTNLLGTSLREECVTKSFEEKIGPGFSGHVLVAMDKFRGTASARQLSEAVATVVAANNCSVDVQPMSDGGEGFRDAFSGEVVVVEVPGPLGAPVAAPITLSDSPSGLRAILEVAEVVGRPHLVSPTRAQALAATSAGAGHLILSAARLGATSILLGCGGSATSDGGLGCYQVLRDAGGLPVPVTAATDVTARFSGLRRYAEQKGVSTKDLGIIDQRLDDVRALYLKEQGVDVELLERSGASGGIPGALAALGGVLTSGFNAVAGSVDLLERLRRSSLVITGEGRFDQGSLEGKVIGGIAPMTDDLAALLVVCGSVELHAARTFRAQFSNVRIISLVERFGRRRAMSEVLACVEKVVAEALNSRHFEGVRSASGRGTTRP